MYDILFSPIKIGQMEIPNRIAMTAMGNHLANADGTVSEADIAFYGARARGGVGLVITECACVDSKTGRGNLAQLTVDDDSCIPGLKKLAEEIHSHGSKIAVQLYHPGRQGIAVVNGVESMKAPSCVECQCVHQPVHEMTLEEIHLLKKQFAAGALRLKKAGIDAAELHAAHGYLLGQFISPYTNKRTDAYGGSQENRLRLLDEIIDEVRAVCGEDYPLLVRISVDEHMGYAGLPKEGIHLAEGVAIAGHLEKKGIDAIDVSSGIYETMNTAWEPVGFDQGWKIEGPKAVKEAVSIPVIGTAVIREPAYAEAILKEGCLDMIGSARAFFADPDWGVKAKAGREKEIRKCISCLYCMETLMAADQCPVPMGCAINFEGGREHLYSEEKLKRNGNGRTVAVIGAGPAGMEAARILALRGFRPVVFEKQGQVGGQLVYAAKPPKKEKTRWLIDYQKGALDRLGVEIRLNTAPDMETLRALNPWAVFLAQGSKPVMPRSIPGLFGENIYTPVDILSGAVTLCGKQVCVVGSGMTGIETAELLCAQGNQVEIYEMADEIGPGIFFQNLIDVMGRIGAFGAGLHPGCRLVKIEGNTAWFEFEATGSGERSCCTFDAAVISLGVAPDGTLAEEIKAAFERVEILGDAGAAGRIEQAVRTGYLAAANLE